MSTRKMYITPSLLPDRLHLDLPISRESGQIVSSNCYSLPPPRALSLFQEINQDEDANGIYTRARQWAGFLLDQAD